MPPYCRNGRRRQGANRIRIGGVTGGRRSFLTLLAGVPAKALARGVQLWSAIEHAMWDAIGRRSEAAYQTQADYAAKLKQTGYTGIKIRVWRPRPLDDVDMVGAMRQAVGPDFHIMLDRTAVRPGWVRDYATALAVARGIERHGAFDPRSRSTAMISRTGAAGSRSGHPDYGRALAGWIQAGCAMLNRDWQEIIGRPNLPTRQAFRIEKGHVLLPEAPVLGLDLNEHTLSKHREAG